METTGWFCGRRERMAMRLGSPAANTSHSAFAHPDAQHFPHGNVQYVHVMSVPAPSVAAVSKDVVKKRIPVHGDRKLGVYLLPLGSFENSSLFQRFLI